MISSAESGSASHDHLEIVSLFLANWLIDVDKAEQEQFFVCVCVREHRTLCEGSDDVLAQVRCELKRKWRSLWLSCRPSRTPRLNSALASRNGIEHVVQFHCNSRTQSILQSETSML